MRQKTKGCTRKILKKNASASLAKLMISVPLMLKDHSRKHNQLRHQLLQRKKKPSKHNSFFIINKRVGTNPPFLKFTTMATGLQMLRKLESIKITDLVGDIIDGNSDKVAELNKKQLMAGKNNRGEFLSPKYSEDPWFKKPGAAKRYADWKKRLFPDTPYDVPNLFIIGVYHNSISVKSIGNNARFNASASFASSIAGKYNNTALGLDDDSKGTAYREIVRTPLIKQLAKGIGCKTG